MHERIFLPIFSICEVKSTRREENRDKIPARHFQFAILRKILPAATDYPILCPKTALSFPCRFVFFFILTAINKNIRVFSQFSGYLIFYRSHILHKKIRLSGLLCVCMRAVETAESYPQWAAQLSAVGMRCWNESSDGTRNRSLLILSIFSFDFGNVLHEVFICYTLCLHLTR